MTAPDLSTQGERYGAVARGLHWLIALLIVGQIAMGWTMGAVDKTMGHAIEAWHISFGVLVLILTLARIAWRLTHRAPPPAAGLKGWETGLAHAVHAGFYLLLLAIPLTGWFMESLGKRPIHVFGLVWPHFPGVAAVMAGQDPRAVKETLEQVHGSPLVWAMIALIVLHVAGAVKHQFDGHPVLWRMLPGRGRT